ncbi:unnamed protein product [Caenorhabditis sp. 36 PRJEB53466]|nr:unnamed protein product [Caenorhabditis sp. 36 PRJEB53466]
MAARNPYHGIDDLNSEFGDDIAESSSKTKRKGDFWEKEHPGEEPKKKRGEEGLDSRRSTAECTDGWRR